MTRSADMDVLVVGSGAAGLTAALAARDSGAGTVLVAEAEGNKLAEYFPVAADTGRAWYIGADGSRGDHLDPAFAVFDRAVLEAATAAGTARYKQEIPGSTKKQSPHWNTDIVDAMVEAGKVHRADSIEALAAAIGVDAPANCVTFGRIAGATAARHAAR